MQIRVGLELDPINSGKLKSVMQIINSVHTRCIVKAVDLQGVFVKIGDFIKFKGFLVDFQRTALLRKSKTPRKTPEKWTFLSLAFYNAPRHTVEIISYPDYVQSRYRQPVPTPPPPAEMITVVAEMITELILFEPDGDLYL